MSKQLSVYERIQARQQYFHAPIKESWPGAQQVDRVSGLSRDDIVRHYIRRKRPVVIADAVPSDAVSPATLRARCGLKPIATLVGAGGSHVLVRGRESAVANFQTLATLGDYLDGFEARVDLPYLTNLCIYTNFPEMRDEFMPPALFEPNWKTRWPLSTLAWDSHNPGGAELFMAPAGTGYGTLHYDGHAVFVGTCQYFGRKLWWLCPPEQSEYLYPVKSGFFHISPVDPFVPDYGKYPLFAKAKPYVVTLEPGDAMFVPASWWHVTHAVTPNIATIVRIVNRHNLMAHLWEFRSFARHVPGMIATSVKNVLSPKRQYT
jgi:hypothetical protein